MGPNPQFFWDLVTLTEEICNGELHCLCSGDGDTIHSLTDLHIRAGFYLDCHLARGGF